VRCVAGALASILKRFAGAAGLLIASFVTILFPFIAFVA